MYVCMYVHTVRIDENIHLCTVCMYVCMRILFHQLRIPRTLNRRRAALYAMVVDMVSITTDKAFC